MSAKYCYGCNSIDELYGIIERKRDECRGHRVVAELLKQKLNKEIGKCIEARRLAEWWRNRACDHCQWVNGVETLPENPLPWEVEK